MATPGGSAQPTAARSGGKIVTTYYRRRLNPYDRPPPPPAPPPSSRSPLSSLIVPACRTIASGAARILSSVFNSSSSSSSSDAETDSVYEDDANCDNDHDICSYGVNESNLEPETSPGRMEYMRKEPQSLAEKSEGKHLIEQLLMQEMFSREECDKLVKIIRSRVVIPSSTKTGKNVFLTDTPWKTINSVTPELCNEAVLEAKKWIKEKKVGQSPGSKFSPRVFALNSATVESEVGSPVDLAKSYMRARPLWASPSTEHIEVRTPSTMITQLISEGKPFSVGDNSFSPSRKRSSLASGTWNIQDEIRRVRSKATEDMLHSSLSYRDQSLFSLSPQTSQKHVVTDIVLSRTGDDVYELNSLVDTIPVDEPAELAAGASTNLVLSDYFSVMEIRQGVVDEAFSNQVTDVPEQKQNSKAIQNEGELAAPMSHHFASPDPAAEQYTDTNLGRRNGSREMEAKEFAETKNANGHPSSHASLSEECIMAENHRHAREQNLSHGNSSNGIHIEERCELLTATSVGVPVAHEAEGVPSGYQNNDEEYWQGESQPEGKHDLTGNSDCNSVKQERKKPSRNIRKVNRKIR